MAVCLEMFRFHWQTGRMPIKLKLNYVIIRYINILITSLLWIRQVIKTGTVSYTNVSVKNKYIQGKP